MSIKTEEYSWICTYINKCLIGTANFNIEYFKSLLDKYEKSIENIDDQRLKDWMEHIRGHLEKILIGLVPLRIKYISYLICELQGVDKIYTFSKTFSKPRYAYYIDWHLHNTDNCNDSPVEKNAGFFVKRKSCAFRGEIGSLRKKMSLINWKELVGFMFEIVLASIITIFMFLVGLVFSLEIWVRWVINGILVVPLFICILYIRFNILEIVT